MKKRTSARTGLIVPCIMISVSFHSIAGTYVVTNTGDSGPGSLRQAMTDADIGDSGPDTVVFRIPAADAGYDPGSGTWTIRPLSPLKNLVWDDGTVIDGTTQAVFIGGDPNPLGPEIVIDGSLAGETYGLYISGRKRNHLTGLVVHGFAYGQIHVWGDSNRVSGCYVGTDASGSRRGGAGAGDTGIIITSGSWNIIGGEFPSERNVISGNGSSGILVTGQPDQISSHNRILGNFIGIRADGSDTLGNAGDGYGSGSGCQYNVIGPGNVISGNQGAGVSISQDGTGRHSVKGNFIGTDPAGGTAWGNFNGIVVSGSSDNVIGGPAVGEGNFVSGNAYDGIVLRGAASDSNDIVGNRIGTDVTGVNSLGNQEHGIRISRGANGNRIGDGTEEGANVISGNGRCGILLSESGTDGNRIERNYLGTGAGGTVPLANGWSGINIISGPRNTAVGPGNVIACNSNYGIQVNGENTVGHTITQNSIHHNGETGIFTYGGGNLGLAPPVLNGIGSVSGTAIPNGRVEVFSDSSDQGRIYEGFTTADGSGNFIWSGTPAGPNVTATVTDAQGNTSAFSAPIRTSAIGEMGDSAPAEFVLEQNHPNPFNPATKIRFCLPSRQRVSLKVTDVLGRLTAVLAEGETAAGKHEVRFDGSGLSSGIYFIRMQAGDFTVTRKMVLLE